MKTHLNTFVLAALISLLMVPSFGMNSKGPKFTSSKDSVDYTRSLSFYKEFYKINLYEHAIGPWWHLFETYPASSEKLYIDGVKMYRNFIQSSSNPAEIDLFVDTMMLIYDQRMEYFGGEGNVLGRQGSDLLAYGRKNMDKVEKAYNLLERSIEIEGEKSRAKVLLNYMTAGLILNKSERIDNNEIIGAYLVVMDIVDQNQGKSSRWEKTGATAEEFMHKENLLTCQTLSAYFEPRMDQNKDNKAFLEQVIKTSSSSRCEGSDMFLTASENLYRLVPEAEAAHQLAIMFTSRGDYPSAIKYLQLAVQEEAIENDTRAEWLYKLSIVSSANKDNCGAIRYAREAIQYKSDFGKAYVALGDAIVAHSYQLNDDFEQRAAFWVAADKYTKAQVCDPSLADEVNQKLNDYKNQFPDKEEIFFRDLKEGSSYRVMGCINETATVMASN